MDLRSPYVVSLMSLPRQDGSVMNWEKELEAPSDLGVELIGVPQGSPLRISLDLQSVSEGVLIQGTVHMHQEGQCARCLRDLGSDHTEPVSELVFHPERKAAFVADGDDEAEELPEIVDDHIDLEPPMRDAIVLELPFVPLCRDDCLGLCPQCGFALNDDPSHRHEPQVDPRWAALQGLTDQTDRR